MRFSNQRTTTTTLLLTSLAALTTSQSPSSSPCPYNYPAILTNTSSNNGLVFMIASNNAATNNRAVQLRANPFLEGGYFGGVDAASPVLLGNFRGAGGMYSQARDSVNQLYDLGPTAYLNQRDETETTTRYTFGFANASVWPGEVDETWKLQGGSQDGTYGLYHDEGLNIVHGFLLCKADIDLDNGAWYQLFYETYTDTPHEFPGCEPVSIRTTVAATIFNGACDIGGFTASF